MATATADGQTSALLDGDVTGGLDLAVLASGTNVAGTNAEAVGGGLVAGNGAISTATAAPVNLARIGDDSAPSHVSVLVDVTLGASSIATAESHGVAVTGALAIGIGVVLSTATTTPTTTSSVGAFSSIDAMRGSIDVFAHHNIDDRPGAVATAQAPGFSGAASANGAVPTATSTATTRSLVAHRSKLSAGRDVTIDSVATGGASSTADALSGAFGVAFGASIVHATSNGTTRTIMDGLITDAQDVTIGAEATDAVVADGASASFGVLAGLSGVLVDATLLPTTVARVGDSSASGAIVAEKDVLVRATALDTSKATAHAEAGGALGFGLASATATASPEVGAVLGDGSSIGTLGSITIVADLDLPHVGETAGASAQSPGAGLVSGDGALADAEAKPHVYALADTLSTLTAGSEVSVIGRSRTLSDASTDAVSFGLAAIGAAVASAESSAQTSASALGKTVDGGSLLVSSAGRDVSSSTAQATTGGFLLSLDGAAAKAIVNPSSTATLGADDGSSTAILNGPASVTAHETASADAKGGSSSLGGFAAVGLVSTHADVTPTIDAGLGSGTTLKTTGGDVVVSATFDDGAGGSTASADGTTLSGGISAISTAAEATVAPVVTAHGGPGATVNAGGAVTFLADSKEDASARSGELAGSLFLAVGGSGATTTLGGSTKASADGLAELLAAGPLEVRANDAGSANSHATALGGGLFVGASGASASATTNRQVGAVLGAFLVLADSVGIDASADDRAMTLADGVAVGGLGAVGTSAATSIANTTVLASLDDDTSIDTPGVLLVDATGANEADGTANTSAGGSVGVDATHVALIGTIDVRANLGKGSFVHALEIGVAADSTNDANGFADGQAGGLVGAGSQKTFADLYDTTVADVGDATKADPTFLQGTFGIAITAHGKSDGIADTVGGNGGLLGSGGGAQGEFLIHSPTVTARVGDEAHLVTLGDLTMTASDDLTPYAHTDQHGAGGISTQEASSDAEVLGEALLVEIGRDVEADVQSLFAQARQADVDVIAYAISDVPVAAAGFSHAYATANAYTSSTVHIAAGVTIDATSGVILDASGPNNTFTSAYAEADVVGIPIPVASAEATSEKHSTDCVIVDASATITTPTLDINAGASPPLGPDDGYSKGTHTNVDGVKSDGTTGPGSQTNFACVDLNADLFFDPASSHTLLLGSQGLIADSTGLLIEDGDGLKSIGDTLTGPFTVHTQKSKKSGGTLKVHATDGQTMGHSTIHYNPFGSLELLNGTFFPMTITGLDTFDNTPTDIVHEGDPSMLDWTYDLVSRPAPTTVTIDSFDPGNIILAGPIVAPTADVSISVGHGDLVVSPPATSGAPDPTILARSLSIDVPSGAIGDATRRLGVEFAADASGTSGFGHVSADRGAFLNTTFGAVAGPADFSIGDIHSASGPVDVAIGDGEAGTALTPTDARWHVGAIDSGTSDVTLRFGQDRSLENDVILEGAIRAPLGHVTVQTANGEITSSGPGQVIGALGIALDGSAIGTHESPILIDMTPPATDPTGGPAPSGVLDGLAGDRGGFFARSIGGPIRVGDIQAPRAGDVELTSTDTPEPGDDITLATSLGRISAPHGNVVLDAGDDFFLADGDSIQALGDVTIRGDVGDADPGVGSIMEIDGDIAGATLLVFGGADGDSVALRKLAAGLSATIATGEGDDSIFVGSMATATPDAPGRPVSVKNGGDLQSILGSLTVDAGPATWAAGGHDRLVLEADGDRQGRQVSIDGRTVAGLTGGRLPDRGGPGYGFNPITYLNIEALDILLGKGDDTIDLTAIDPETATTIDGGDGDDLFRVGAIGSTDATVPSPVLLGGPGSNTIQGPDSNNAWRIIGVDGGVVAGPNAFSFGSIGSLKGGRLDDVFAFDDGATLDGSIDGGAGTNALDYSLYTTPVEVDLAAGTATGVAGGVANITSVVYPKKK